MVFYLPKRVSFYGGAFLYPDAEGKHLAGHEIVTTGEQMLISPQCSLKEALHPENLMELRYSVGVEQLWLIDRVRNTSAGDGALIHIVDHRNLAGWNPLAGNTPVGDRPRFSDMSEIYAVHDIGLPQRSVNTVGHKRFLDTSVRDASEVAALVGLSAAYAGITVVAIGWNDSEDRNGAALREFLNRRCPSEE